MRRHLVLGIIKPFASSLLTFSSMVKDSSVVAVQIFDQRKFKRKVGPPRSSCIHQQIIIWSTELELTITD